MPHRKVSGDCFHACKGRVGSLICTVHLFPAVMVWGSIHNIAQCSARGERAVCCSAFRVTFLLPSPHQYPECIALLPSRVCWGVFALLALAGGIGFLSHHWMKITETSLKMFPSGSPVQLISKAILQLPEGAGGNGLVEARGHSLKKGLHSDPKKRHTRLSHAPW